MNILGINSVFHESSAALMVDGKVVAACEEERFSRIKHGKPALVDNPQELPENAIRFCLDFAGLKPTDIDCVAYSYAPQMRRSQFRAEWWPDPGLETSFLAHLGKVEGAISGVMGRPIGSSLRFVSHHLAHAASVFYPSGFDTAAILVVDGIGEADCSMLAKGEGRRIEVLETFRFPHSIGFVWEHLSAYLGFSSYDASKVMGLAAYGDPEVYRKQFASIVHVSEDSYAVDDAIDFRTLEGEGLRAIFGPPRHEDEEIAQRHKDIAAALQEMTDRAVVALARRLERLVGGRRLCYSGGVALNCVTNALISRMTGFSDLFISSAPHDAGTAIGAALVAHCASTKDAKPPTGGASPYLGPEYHDKDILAAIKAAGLQPRKCKNAAAEAADMIADGNIVGWFQGRMEFGPRALGNRSLLADPRRPDTRAILNRRVKHREDFRPFAPSVLAEHAEQWFELGPPTHSHEFMLFAYPTVPGKAEKIPAVIHEDGTARVQIVRRTTNPRYHALISHFHRRTGVPMVLNTSFNDSEPIVCTPAHAIATFRAAGLDALFMGDYLLTAES